MLGFYSNDTSGRLIFYPEYVILNRLNRFITLLLVSHLKNETGSLHIILNWKTYIKRKSRKMYATRCTHRLSIKVFIYFPHPYKSTIHL